MGRWTAIALAAALALTGLAGCFGPDFGVIACTESIGCPGDLVCVDDICVERGAAPVDAGPDAAGSFSLSDETAADFAAGDFFFAMYDGLGVVPESQSGGRFTSRVFDSGSASTRWTTFVFTPSAPYGKPLPDNGGTESGYREGSLDMTENALLLHCEDAGGGGTVDTSGRGHLVSARGGGDLRLRTGRLGQGCSIDIGNHFEVAVTADGGLSAGDNDYTWMMWARTSTDCAGNDVFMGMDAEPGSARSHQWLGCARGGVGNSGACDDDIEGSVGGTHRTIQSEGGGTFCGTPTINDSEWHHVAIVKSGHPAYELRAYIDGALADTASGTYAGDMEYDVGDVLTFGTFPDPTFDVSAGTIDEIAVINRALDPSDIAAAWTRGASAIRVLVRACQQDDCEDADFGGPDGDDQGFLVDPPTALTPPTPATLDLPTGRYFQYRVEFDRDNGALPRFEAATITGVR